MTPNPPLADWIKILTPPKPYLHALRRSFQSGLHVLVLTQQADGKLHVLSSVDHGTTQGTRITEGASSDLDEVARLIEQTCDKWNVAEIAGAQASDKKEKRYYYAKPNGGISSAVSRDILFQLVAQGQIGWESQVWEDIEDLADSGMWRPIVVSLGFPQGRDIMTGSNQ